MPLKVCRKTAIGIREQVRVVLTALPKVPPYIVKNLREEAEQDVLNHKEWDSTFKWGNGPGAERRGH